MTLHFVQRRFVAAIDYSDAADAGRAWLEDVSLTAQERMQLLTNVLQLELHPELTAEAIFAGDLAFFDRHFDAMAEAPLEWWQVTDQDQTTLYQLWLRGGDGGVLLHDGTTTPVAPECIVQSSWHGDAVLGDELEAAKELLRAARTDPDAAVLRISFTR